MQDDQRLPFPRATPRTPPQSKEHGDMMLG